MALLSIPVWTIPPDWADVVNEYLEWKTNVFTSTVGAEQRQGIRLSPRRALEYVVRPTGAWRTYYDALISSAFQVDFYNPLWHDVAYLNAAVAPGDLVLTVRDIRVEMALAKVLFIQGETPYDYEILEVTSVATVGGNTQFTLADTSPIVNTWKRGNRILAAAPGMLTTQPSFDRLSDGAYQSTVRFDLVQANDWPHTPTLPTYRDFPVVEFATNDGDPQSGSYFRYSVTLDNSVGIPFRKDFGGINFPSFLNTNFVSGRVATDDLRSLLYMFSGRQASAWIVYPTADFTLAVNAFSADTHIDVERSGFTDLGGPTVGRQDIRILLRDGAILYRRITASSILTGGKTERLGLDSALGGDIRHENVVRISFMAVGRLDQDMITLTHQTDTDGVCSVALAVRLAPDIRVGADWFPPPFPLSNMGDCGPTVPGRFWARINNGPWNGNAAFNPSIGEGGVDISGVTGDLYPLIGFNTGFIGHEPVTVNFGGSPFREAVPYRAAAWGVATTLNPADKNVHVTLSNGNLTAELDSESTGDYVRATTSSNTQFGFRYFEVHMDNLSQNNFIGFANAGFPLDGSGAGFVYVLFGGGEIFANSGSGSGVSIGSPSVGDTICILVYTGSGV